MRESTTYIRGVATKARQLSAQARDRGTREMLTAVAKIFDAHAEGTQQSTSKKIDSFKACTKSKNVVE